MNIVDFYKRLSRILEMRRENAISPGDAEFQLVELKEDAKKAKLNIKISDYILSSDNLSKYDDEMSYEEPSSYDGDSSSNSEDEYSY